MYVNHNKILVFVFFKIPEKFFSKSLSIRVLLNFVWVYNFWLKSIFVFKSSFQKVKITPNPCRKFFLFFFKIYISTTMGNFFAKFGSFERFWMFPKRFFFLIFQQFSQKNFWRIKIIFLTRFFILKNFFIKNSSLPSQKWKLPEIYAEKKNWGVWLSIKKKKKKKTFGDFYLFKLL